MTEKMYLVVSSLFISFFTLLYLCHDSYGKLQDPGLTEGEIRQLWQEFEEEKGSARVKGDYPYMSCFKRAAEKHKVPLPLLIAVAQGESNFDSEAVSDKDCHGIMQIKWPETANDLGIFRKSMLRDPCTNINAGAQYLSWLMERFDSDIYLAVAAYNYGPNAIKPGRVPDGAQWYAAYIHRHLQYTLSKPYEETDRLLILEFTFYKNALKHLDLFKNKIRDADLEIFKSTKYTYDIYVTFKTPEERERFLSRFRERTGIEPLGLRRLKGERS